MFPLAWNGKRFHFVHCVPPKQKEGGVKLRRSKCVENVASFPGRQTDRHTRAALPAFFRNKHHGLTDRAV
jgi:hypothetical protein